MADSLTGELWTVGLRGPPATNTFIPAGAREAQPTPHHAPMAIVCWVNL